MSNDVGYATLAVPRPTSAMPESVPSRLFCVHINVDLMLEVKTR